jgi:hypothetical protein
MNTTRALPIALLSLFLLIALSAQQPDAGVIGWYNGEWQSGIPGLQNWYLDPDNFSRVYDEFKVPEDGWTITGVFSDNGLYQLPEVSRASWEIRRDMALGRGGKVVASRVAHATQIPDPSVTPSRYPASEVAKHFRIQVDGLRVRLPAGRYWLSVAPVGQGQSYLSATRGANAVGTDAVRPGIALFHRAGGPDFVPAETVGSRGQMGIGQHFAQGVIIAK